MFQFTAALDADFGPEDVVTDYQSEELDLTGVTKTTLYTNVRGGMALWEPGQTSNLLTLNGAGLSGGLGGLLLPAGENEIALGGKYHGERHHPGGGKFQFLDPFRFRQLEA